MHILKTMLLIILNKETHLNHWLITIALMYLRTYSLYHISHLHSAFVGPAQDFNRNKLSKLIEAPVAVSTANLVHAIRNIPHP